MNFRFESAIRRTARRLGFDIRRYRPERSEAGRLARMLAVHDVDVVFDVGANVGQFASALRSAGYQQRLVSIEPLAAAWRQLEQASSGDAMWEALRCAVGAQDGEIELHIAANSVSSSPLAMLDTHAVAAPESIFVGTERVPLARLDTLARPFVSAGSVPFIKIDTQGYEDRVLDGATEVLSRAAGIQLELSLVPLYEGQQLFRALLDRLEATGFELWGIWPGFCDPGSGRMLQVDAILFRARRDP